MSHIASMGLLYHCLVVVVPESKDPETNDGLVEK